MGRRRIPVVRPVRPHGPLWLATGLLLVVGLATMASIGEAWEAMGKQPQGIFGRHVVRIVLGVIAAVVASSVRPSWWRHLAKPALLTTVVLVVISVLPRVGLHVPGIHLQRNGAYRWLSLGPLSFMPSEAFKLALVVWLAGFLSRIPAPLTVRRASPGALLPALGLVGLFLQPAVSTGVGILCLMAVMWYVAGGEVPRAKTLLVAALLTGAALALVPKPSRASWQDETPSGTWGHVNQRLSGYVPPWRWQPKALCYNSYQSLVAMGYGGFKGRGLGKGKHVYGRLPEAHSDFTLAVVGEELGWIGTTVVVLAWVVIVCSGYSIARQCTSPYCFLLAVGLTANLAISAALHAAVVTALVPATGQNMPFVSYGGGAMCLHLFSVGMLDSVHRRSE